MSAATLAIVSAILQALIGFIPQIPSLITAVKTAASLLTQTTPITAAQEAALWSALQQAHADLQAAGGATANVLAPVVALAP